jgi:hypothetical protein
MNIQNAIVNVGDSASLKKVKPADLIAQGLDKISVYKNKFDQVMIGMSNGTKIAKIRVKMVHAALPTTKEELINWCRHQFNTYQLYLGVSDGRSYLVLGKKAPDFAPTVTADASEVFAALEMAGS